MKVRGTVSDAFDDERHQEYPPPWFTNEEDPAPEEADHSLRRTLIGLGAIIVISVLLLIPVLQAEILQRQRESLPDAAMDRTALQFASALLFGRSEGQAMIFATDESADDVRSVLRVVLNRPQPSSRARLQLVSTPCGRQNADACFTGRIFDPAQPMRSGIRFGLERRDDEPRVIWVELDQTIV